MRKLFKILPLAAVLLVTGSIVQSKDLIVDLSDSVVQITTGFSGTDLLLFGAKKSEGDVIVVIRGPWENQVVRRKERIAGVWVNRTSVEFKELPSFYWMASNYPVEEVLRPSVRDIRQIGLDKLLVELVDDKDQALHAEFRAALIRQKKRMGLYSDTTHKLLFLDDTLFRTEVHFPANVSVGTYGIDVFLVRDKEIVADQTTLLNVRKFGIEAGVYGFAHRHSFAYGVAAVLIACAAGWLANIAFGKA